MNANSFDRSFTLGNNFMKSLHSHWTVISRVWPWADWVRTSLSLVRHQSKSHLSHQPAVWSRQRRSLCEGWCVGWNILLLSDSTFIAQPAERKLIYLQCHSFFYSFIFFGSVCAHTACESLEAFIHSNVQKCYFRKWHWSLTILKD